MAEPSDLFALAEEWQSLGELEWALAEYGRLRRAGLGGAEALIRRAALLRELGRLVEAERDLADAAELEPTEPWALQRHGQLLEALRRSHAAAPFFAEALARNRHLEIQVCAAHNLLHTHRVDDAYRLARTWPENLADWWEVVRRNALDRRRALHAEARRLIRERRQAADPYHQAYKIADALILLGRVRLVKRYCERIMREHPHAWPFFDLYRRVLEREGGAESAAAFLRSLAYLHPAEPARRWALGLALYDLGRYAEVIEVLGPAPVRDEADDLRAARLAALRALGRDEEARLACRAWLDENRFAVFPAGFTTAAALAVEGGAEAAAARDLPVAQFWDAPEPPEDVQETMRSWAALNPTLRHVVYHTETARDFLRRAYGGGMAEVFDLCRHAAMKADLFRIAHLAAEGGLWADADERCLRPVEALAAASQSVELLAPLSGDTPGYVHNFFLGARAGSPLLLAALEEASAGVRRAAASGERPDIWQITGPGLITRSAAAALLDPERGHAVRLISLSQYRAHAVTNEELAYKRRHEGNWRLQ